MEVAILIISEALHPTVLPIIPGLTRFQFLHTKACNLLGKCATGIACGWLPKGNDPSWPEADLQHSNPRIIKKEIVVFITKILISLKPSPYRQAISGGKVILQPEYRFSSFPFSSCKVGY